jgi:hypothetical protein
LEALNYSVLWDLEIPVGADWNSWIREIIDQSKCVIVFWTANSLASDEVKDEAAIAKRQRKLLPIQLDHIVDEKKLPLGHGQLQLAKLHSWNGDLNDAEWRKFVASIGRIVGERNKESLVGTDQKNEDPIRVAIATNQISSDVADAAPEVESEEKPPTAADCLGEIVFFLEKSNFDENGEALLAAARKDPWFRAREAGALRFGAQRDYDNAGRAEANAILQLIDAKVIDEAAIATKSMAELPYSVHKFLYRRLRSASYVKGELPRLTFEDMRRGLIYWSKR